MKTKKTVTHNTLSLKVVDGKAWVKLAITRRGASITANTLAMREGGVAEKIKRLFQEAMDQGMSYGNAINYVEAGFASA